MQPVTEECSPTTMRDFDRKEQRNEIYSEKRLSPDIVSQVEVHQHPLTSPESTLRLKLDLRLCTIAGLLCSLNLLDSGLISSASVTSMVADLDLSGDRYSISIFVFTIASIACQLPATLLVRYLGPRIFFGVSCFLFGTITLCTAFVQDWRQLIALRVLLGISMSGIYPGLMYLISTWYTRREQQLRFAYMQTVEVLILGTGTIVNFGLQKLDGENGMAGWRYMFLVNGTISAALGIVTYFWMVDFPENATKSFYFLSVQEAALAVSRIEKDRGDVMLPSFSWVKVFEHVKDPKAYGFACMFFCQNIVSTALSYFLPTILQGGLGFSTDASILLAAPPYYYSVVPVILSSLISDRYSIRGPVIIFNSCCLIAGIGMLGFSEKDVVRYIGLFLATGAYISNWAALSTYWSNNVVGQYKRAFFAALVTAFNGAGGIAGSFIFRQVEAPRYYTAIWTCLGSHIIMIAFVAAFSIFFWQANRLQCMGKKVVEGKLGFRFTY